MSLYHHPEDNKLFLQAEFGFDPFGVSQDTCEYLTHIDRLAGLSVSVHVPLKVI